MKDLGSSNGTFVNGVKVDRLLRRGGRHARLRQGGVPARGAGAGRHAGAPRSGRRSPAAPSRARPSCARCPSAADAVAASGRTAEASRPSWPATPIHVEKDRQKLQILLEVSKGLTRATNVDALLQKVADYAFQILEADRCAILLVDDHGQLNTKISRDKRGADAPQAVPQSIARMAVDDKVAVLSDNAGEDQRFSGQSILMQRVRSALCAPLIGSENKVLGVLYVDNFQSTASVRRGRPRLSHRVRRDRGGRDRERAVRRAHSPRGAGAQQLRALLHAAPRRAHRRTAPTP